MSKTKVANRRFSLALFVTLLYLAGCQAVPPEHSDLGTQVAKRVSAKAETSSMLGTGDVADDPAVWVHPTNKSRSVILGTNKSKDGRGGLYAFDLDGKRFGSDEWVSGVNRFDNERYNSVDLRYNFPAGQERWDIVAASNRSDREIDIFKVRKTASGDFSGLQKVGELPLGSGLAPGSDAPYGLAMYYSQRLGRYYVFISDKEGRVAQYQLRYNPSGSLARENLVTADRLGLWDVSDDGLPVEGIVADDEKDVVYIASENLGLYRYGTTDGKLNPNNRTTVDTPGKRLQADIEGLTLHYAANGQGYLIASSQGSDSYTIYERSFLSGKANSFVTDFAISSGAVDEVTNTDGIDVASVNLGGAFKGGLFIAHDGEGNSPSNYKLLPWTSVAGGELRVDTSQDPRRKTP